MRNVIQGKRAKNFKDHTGKRFGRLLVIKLSSIFRYKTPSGQNKTRAVWECKCDCGKIKNLQSYVFTTGNTKSCGCLKREAVIAFNKKMKRLDAGDAAANGLWANYIGGARKRNLVWDLSKNSFKMLTSSNCFYCGRRPSQIYKGIWSNYTYNGIDRVDTSKGYTEKNSVSCCGPCNLMKLDYSYKEFIQIVSVVFFHSVLGVKSKTADPRKLPIERTKSLRKKNYWKTEIDITRTRQFRSLNKLPNKTKLKAIKMAEDLGLDLSTGIFKLKN